MDWKDVNKELPKDEEKVLIYVNDDYGKYHIFLAGFESETIEFSVDFPHLVFKNFYFKHSEDPNSAMKLTHWAYITTPKEEK